MYKAKLWDEDKWNIHSSSYSSAKYGNIFSSERKDDSKYHEQKYGAVDKAPSSEYMRKEENKEREEKKHEAFFEDLEEQKKDEKIKEEDVVFKAAKHIFSEKKYGTKRILKKKDIDTIEDAIKKAIEEEKKIVVIDG